MANFIFIQSDSDLKQYAEFRIARIDGKKAQTLKEFYGQIAKELEFPDYFAFNLDSLDEVLNDLDWLDEEKIALYITHSDEFLAQEKNESRKAELLNILDASAEDWKWVDEEEEGVTPRHLVFLFQPGDALKALLDKEGFAYDCAV